MARRDGLWASLRSTHPTLATVTAPADFSRTFLLRGVTAVDRLTILDRLKAEAAALREKYRLESLAVFGSVARGDDREGSDLDILVTFQGKTDFDRFMGLKLDLEDMFGRKVDLGTPDTLRPEMKAAVEKELIHVP
jgi:predicted nucleotidyltransferase